MNTFLYGTGNPAKLTHMRNMLAPLDVQIIGVNELGITLPEADESGNSPLENARIKALVYYEALRRPVFSCDTGLYINGLPDSEQPGVHVRRVNGRQLSDDEMITHYSSIAKRLGGRATARYHNAICLVADGGKRYEHFGSDIASSAFYIADAPHASRVKGFPLDCLAVNMRTGQYYCDETTTRAHEDTGMASGFQAFFCMALTQLVV